VAYYAIGNRHSNLMYCIYLLDWKDIEYWIKWCKEKEKKSIPWVNISQRAGHRKTLYQNEGDNTVERFMTEENRDKIREFVKLQDGSFPVADMELDYEW